MTGHNLRNGYTTGACAAAAAKGAALMLARQESVTEVTIALPAGVSATFALNGQSFTGDSASCFVIKDAGDDPDITNGAEIHATVTLTPPPLTGGGWGVGETARGNNGDDSTFPPTPTLPRQGGGSISIVGGVGIGKATKPGLAIAPGEWAINPVPRRMIAEAVLEVFPPHPSLLTPHSSPLIPHVEISIPDGEVRALKTLNARLGIIGGLSILGTSGIVRPISAKAWTDTIDAALDVARACACETVVFSTGRTSELAAQNMFKVRSSRFGVETLNPELRTLNQIPLPEEAYVMMGDHVAHAMHSSRQRGFNRPLIACQFAKLLKIACGYANTHAAASEMDLARLRAWAEEERLPSALLAIISSANTAREIVVATNFDPTLVALAGKMAANALRGHAPGIEPLFLVADYNGRIIAVIE